jgi:hypothetical protein
MSETYSPSTVEGSPDVGGGGNRPYTRNAKVFGVGAAGNQTSQ